MLNKNIKQNNIERVLNNSNNSNPTDPETLNSFQVNKRDKETANNK